MFCFGEGGCNTRYPCLTFPSPKIVLLWKLLVHESAWRICMLRGLREPNAREEKWATSSSELGDRLMQDCSQPEAHYHHSDSSEVCMITQWQHYRHWHGSKTVRTSSFHFRHGPFCRPMLKKNKCSKSSVHNALCLLFHRIGHFIYKRRVSCLYFSLVNILDAVCNILRMKPVGLFW